MNLLSLTRIPRPWGLELAMVIEADGRQFPKSPFVPLTEEATEARIAQEVETQKTFVQRELDAEQETRKNEKLAAYAVAAKSILSLSDKIPSEYKAVLDQLEAAVKSAAGVDLPAGESATLLVREIINDPDTPDDLKQTLEQALTQIVTITGGVL